MAGSVQDWYARHLGNGRQQAPAPPQGYTPPQGSTLVPVAQPAYQQQQQQAVMPWEQATNRDPWSELPPSVDTTKIPKGYVNPENFLYMAQFWRGGKGNKEAEHCPSCDGVVFRRFEGRREAAPLCTACGWNGMFDQGHPRA